MSIRVFRTALSALLIFAAVVCAIPVHAEEDTGDGSTYSVSFPVTVSNPDKKIPAGTEFTLIIEGQRHAPLPDPPEIIAGLNGTYEFAPITFNEPGNYKYTVKQIALENNNIITDSKEYEIVVTVIRGEDGRLEGGVTISDRDMNNKSASISFRNNYKSKNGQNGNNGSPDNGDSDSSDAKKDQEHSPGTGEPLSPAFFCFSASGVLLLLCFAARIMRNRKDRIDG